MIKNIKERSPNGMAVVLKTTDDESCAFDSHPLRQFFNLSIGQAHEALMERCQLREARDLRNQCGFI